jgi:GntR family transcriptional regulator / MocR family aminotransferase
LSRSASRPSPGLIHGFFAAAPGRSLQRQVYDSVVAAILGGQLRPGDRLPSSRELASALDISRNTAIWAIEQLAAEGFVETRRGSGSFVASSIGIVTADAPHRRSRPRPALAETVRVAARAERYRKVAASLRLPQRPVPFRMNMPAVDVFPVALWRRLNKSLVSDPAMHGGAVLLGETEAAGYRPLREAIARYLALSRGVTATADQVVIVAGAQQGLDLAIRLLLDPGDAAWCEDPGFPGAVAALEAGGATIVPVPVDEAGIDVATGLRMAPDARLAVVCPSSQFPLGATLSVGRRLALIDWAERHQSWIIEDDYDSEFRYRGRPVRSLQGLDGGRRVIYIGTFSKVLFPGLRLAYLVVPEPLVDLFVNARIVAGRQSPTFEQALVERFIARGHLFRHIARMRKLYGRRRIALIEACHRHLAPWIRLDPGDTGLQMIGWLPAEWSDQSLAEDAAEAGLEVTPLSRLAIARQLPPAVLLGFGAFDESRIDKAAERLAEVLSSMAARLG